MAPYNEALGRHVFPTQTRSIMNAMVWPSKLAGCIVYEPLVARLGYKITMYIVSRGKLPFFRRCDADKGRWLSCNAPHWAVSRLR